MIEFRLLGGVEVAVDGRRVDVGHARQRCVLAVLVLNANQAVSADQLIDRVWGDNPPQQVRGSLRSYMTRLRHALDAAHVTISARSGQYTLTVDEQTIDLHRFRRAVDAAQAADDDQALALFEQALGLWRGDALAGVDTPWLVDLRVALERERVAARLAYNDIALRHGRHAELLPELSTMASKDPLDERVAGQLMLALYRGGRQADALEHYERTRRRLADELGADPSPPLRRLHHQILTADPALAGSMPTKAPTPQQLPAAPGTFVGREPELDRLTSVLAAQSGATMVIYAVGGAGGIGKTSLAVHWAHRNANRFPDGQLYVNLRGFGGGEPVPAEVALRDFLGALGADPIPPTVQAQSLLYRSLLAGKRMLIVLDNALDTNQVVPLLPGTPSCTVVITSRTMLTGLVATHAAHPISLDTLSDSDARNLLNRYLGSHRTNAQPDAVDDLVRCCCGLPLALSIVAARAATHPEHPLTTLADELRDETSRLDALDTGELELSLRAVFSWSYHALSPEAATLFRLIGLAPGPDIGLAAAASLIAQPTARTTMLLRQLETAHAVQQPTPGRYRMHDLVRLYAAERARLDVPNTDGDALRRLVDHYSYTAHAADRLLRPHRSPIQIAPPTPDCAPHSLKDAAAAWTWFTAEHRNLLAVQQVALERGWYQAVWQLAWSLHTFHCRRGHLDDNLAALRTAMVAVDKLGDPTAYTVAHRLIGHAYVSVARHTEAVGHLQQSLRYAEQTGDTLAQAEAHGTLSGIREVLGDDQQALQHAILALRLFQVLGRPVGEGEALNAVGWHRARIGQYEQARVDCERALALRRQHHDRDGEPVTLDTLGYIAHQTGQYAHALNHYRQAVTLYRDNGNAYNEASTLDRLGQTYRALDELEQARQVWQQARELYELHHRTADAERVGHQLAALDQHMSQET